MNAAERMQRVRDGARRSAAAEAARAVCTLDLGDAALTGLEEDLFSSPLSLTDLEHLSRIVIDHARGAHADQPAAPAPDVGIQSVGTVRNLWKYNVSAQNLVECVRHSLFAEKVRRQLDPGDLLILQIVKKDLERGAPRTTHVMQFDQYDEDTDGISVRLWNEPFDYLIRGRMYALEAPFSLEDLGLSRSYSVQGKIGPERIAEDDRSAVLAAVGPLR